MREMVRRADRKAPSRQADRSETGFTAQSEGRRLQFVLLPNLSAPPDLHTRHPSVRACLDATKDARASAICRIRSHLVLVVVNSHPGTPLVDGKEDAWRGTNGSSRVMGGIRLACRGLSEAKCVNLVDVLQAKTPRPVARHAVAI
jgi:hypothetical protein